MSQALRGCRTRTSHITATTKVAQLVSKDPSRICVFLYNNGSVTVYILSAQNLDAADGIPVAAGGTYKNDTTTAALWIVAASGTADVRVQVDGD
mgnify:CR=1 FL=1